jgi:hypothetical protein
VPKGAASGESAEDQRQRTRKAPRWRVNANPLSISSIFAQRGASVVPELAIQPAATVPLATATVPPVPRVELVGLAKCPNLIGKAGKVVQYDTGPRRGLAAAPRQLRIVAPNPASDGPTRARAANKLPQLLANKLPPIRCSCRTGSRKR